MYHKWESCDVCFLRYKAWHRERFVLLGYFLPFYPTNNPQKSKFWKNEITTIILNKSTKNYDHMLYRSWYMAHGGCNFHFLFWADFCPFKAPGYITILPMRTKNWDQMMYGPWNISVMDRLVDGRRSDIEVGVLHCFSL